MGRDICTRQGHAVHPDFIVMAASFEPGNCMLFALSKLVGFLVSPINLLGLALLVAFAVTRHKSHLLVLLGLLLIFHSPLGMMAIYPLENRFERAVLPQTVDGIIVLGGAIDTELSRERGHVELESSGDRLISFVTLARRFPSARLVYSGGSARVLAGGSAEAGFIPALLEDLGIPPERLTLENRSRNTFENLLYTRDLVKPAPGERWVMITSAFHMPRAMGIARKLGWDLLAWPVDYNSGSRADLFDFTGLARSNFRALENAMKEWAGLVAYRAMGRSSDLFPAP